MKFPHYFQHDSKDCGIACLKMIAKFHKKEFSLSHIRELAHFTKRGASIHGLSEAAEKLGLRSYAAKVTVENLIRVFSDPCIIHWNTKHYVVLYKISKGKFLVSDPSYGEYKIGRHEFEKSFINRRLGESMGAVMFLEPKPEFYKSQETKDSSNFKKYIAYFKPYSKHFFQILSTLFLGLGVALLLPLLLQAIVDIGINGRNIQFLNLILICQLTLSLSSAFLEYYRNWMFLYISARINIQILSDFLSKLLRLPLAYFDNKLIGDFVQRISDNSRIETFISSITLNTIFSILNVLVFGVILLIYNPLILTVFLIGTALNGVWAIFFLNKKKELNHRNFELGAKSSSSMIDILSSVTDLKLNSIENQRRWQWETLKREQFTLNKTNLRINQFQRIGSHVLMECKNITIYFLAAKLVIEGQISFGMMLSIQYMLGQLNSPFSYFIGLLDSYQNAKISLERLNEVHNHEDEDAARSFNSIPSSGDIHFRNLSFAYDGDIQNSVLKKVNLTIRRNKITAIVGESGSGKSTILKLLLNFYQPTDGTIQVDSVSLANIKIGAWRQECGGVLQESKILADTVYNNVVLYDDQVDEERLIHSLQMANLWPFVNDLPQGLETKLGSQGLEISTGQKQRLLLARLFYSKKHFLLLDEATNALDANNERIIIDNIFANLKGHTLVIVAHRLSTIKNADHIIVVNQGEVIEEGSHHELLLRGSFYQKLIKNQL